MRLLPIVLLSGCSLSTFDQVACTTNADCRDAFGLLQVCNADAGFCEAGPSSNRCATSFPEGLFERPQEFADDLLVGAIFNGATDTPNIQSANLAVLHANETGDIDGRKTTLVHCTSEEDGTLDSLELVDASVANATWLTDVLGAQVIVGPPTSDESQAVYEAVEASGALVISPSASAPSLTFVDGVSKSDEEPGRFWRTVTSDEIQGKVIARDLLNRSVSNLAIISQESSYARGLADVVEEEFVGGGGKVEVFRFSNVTTFDTAVGNAGETNATEVMFVSSEEDDIISFVNTVDDLVDYQTKDIFLTDAAADQFFLDGSDDDFYGRIRGTRPEVPHGKSFDDFARSYNSQFNDDAAQSVFAAFTYDATWLAMYGAAWATFNESAVDGTGMARGLRNISDSKADLLEIKPDTWNLVRAQFEEGQSIDVRGASGELDYDPETEETQGRIEVWQIIDDDDGFCVDTLCEADGTTCGDPNPGTECP